MKYDVVIVGAGFSGAVLAERYANVLKKKVLVIEKRDHLGGNCYDYLNEEKLLVPKYGPHFFHTNSDKVWRYLSQFTKWIPYEHRVLSFVDGFLVPIPVNINTVNILFDENIKNEEEMERWLKKNIKKIRNPQNSEEAALRRVGKRLYEKMFKYYTKKQWDLWPKELDPSVMDRIPVRLNFDDRYFADKYQAMPKNGYYKIFEKMLNNRNIKVKLNADFFKIKDQPEKYQKLFYTGPIDQFFNYKFGKLQYRSLKFKYQTLKMKSFQPVAQVNYPNDHDFTRITEPKHATGQRSEFTTIIKEYPKWGGEPYYPVPSEKNQEVYKKYEIESLKLNKRGIFFVGRLANYQYINMDQSIEKALELFRNLELNK